jgi:hypothetical protein
MNELFPAISLIELATTLKATKPRKKIYIFMIVKIPSCSRGGS